MERFLTYLYEATLPYEISFEDAADLLAAADKYQVASLSDACASSLSQTLSPDNAIQCLILGNIYRNERLKSEAMKAIENSGMALSSMNGFDELLSHPQVAMDLLKLDKKNVVVVNPHP